MPTHFSALKTPGGYLCGEVTSALQKSVRRGKEEDALFWATELELAGFGEYVFNRLRIMASEDVGMADANVAVQVRALYDNWVDRRKKEKEPGTPPESRLYLLQAVMVLARAPKWRGVDHAYMLMYEGERPTREIPDYALDKHTARGRKMGRGVDHFVEVGSKLENEAPIDDPYKERGQRAHKAWYARTGGSYHPDRQGRRGPPQRQQTLA
jgi:replication-associated recombination protein RarA